MREQIIQKAEVARQQPRTASDLILYGFLVSTTFDTSDNLFHTKLILNRQRNICWFILSSTPDGLARSVEDTIRIALQIHTRGGDFV